MKRLFVTVVVLGLALILAAPVLCEKPEDKGYGWGHGHMMGYGSGGGPMMGPGYGRGMHGPGWGMYGRGHMMDRGWGHGPRNWSSMTPEQQEKWEKTWSGYQMETLELRKQLATKQMELETLWAQPRVDSGRIEKLSKEVADLEAELGKKRDKYLLQCRQEFGDQGWTCPGGWR